MVKYTLTQKEGLANPCAICGKPSTFVVIRNSGKTTFGCRNCFR